MKQFFVILLFSLIIISNLLKAQTFETSVFEKQKYNGSLEFVYLNNSLYVLSQDNNMQMAYTAKLFKSKHSTAIKKYSLNMKLESEKELSGGKKVYGPFPSILKVYNNKLYLFYFSVNEEKENINVFCSEINPETLEPKSAKEVMILEQKNFGFGKMFFTNYQQKLNINKSSDGSKFLLTWSANNKDNFFYTVLDSGMNILKTKVVQSSSKQKMVISETAINNNGSIFVICGPSSLYAEKIKGEGKILDMSYGNTKTESFFISNDNTKNILNIVGVFSEVDDKQKGVFFCQLNSESLEKKNISKSEFNQRIKSEIQNQLFIYHGSKKKYVSDPLEFVPIFDENGKVNLLGISKKETTYSTSNGGLISRIVYGSMLYCGLSGESIFFTKIPKACSFSPDFFAFSLNDKTNILYADYEQSLNKESKLYEDLKGNFTTISAVVFPFSEISREVLNKTISGASLKSTVQVSENTLLIPCGTDIEFWMQTNRVETGRKNELNWILLKVR